MPDNTEEAEMVKVRFTGTTEGRNSTGVIRLSGRDDLVLGAAEDGDVGEVSLDELGRLQSAGIVLEVIDGSEEDQERAPEPDEVVVPPADTTPASPPVAGRRGRATDQTSTEDGASS